MMNFNSLGAFALHLSTFSAHLAVEENESLERAARIVEREAKGSVGEYQPQSGPFAAWAPLAESTKEDRVRQGYPADEPELRSGRMRDTIEHTVLYGRGEAEIGSNDPILEMQELGTSRMPPRSIMGGAAYRVSDEVAKELAIGTLTFLMAGSISPAALRLKAG